MAETSRFMNTEGAYGEPYAVKHTVTAAEDTAGSLTIRTPFNSVTTWHWSTYSSGEKQEQDAYAYSWSGGTVTLSDGTHNLNSGDEIHLWASGRGGR